jgi:CspA family cold shock protein
LRYPNLLGGPLSQPIFLQEGRKTPSGIGRGPIARAAWLPVNYDWLNSASLLSCKLHHYRRLEMARGTVKWFNPTKGYGFIQPQGGGKDVFVHISAVERAGLSTLNEGQQVEFEEVANRGKTSAENLKVV